MQGNTVGDIVSVRKEERQGRKALLFASALATGGLLISSGATQFVAYRVGYHPALGRPLFGHFYAPWSWLEWMKSPWANNAAATFQMVKAGVIVGAFACMAPIMLAAAGNRRRPIRHEGVHGTARFQTAQEVRSSGLLPRVPSFFQRLRGHKARPSAGVYVGGWTDKRGQIHYLRHDGPEHCIVIAPTRSGKGVGNILPTLLSWPASALVYDEKGELWQLTAGWRSKHANNVVIRWEPGAVSGSAGFNFLEEVRLRTPHEVSDAQSISQAICDPKGEGLETKDHWTKTAFALITGCILYVCYRALAHGKAGSLADLATLLSDPSREADDLWQEMVRHPHPAIAAAGRDMLDKPERERGSVLSSAKVYLTLFTDPLVVANSRQSDFRLADLMNHDRPVSLYIVTRGADKERLRPLVRLLLTLALRHSMGAELRYQAGQALMPHRHRLLVMLDEFPSLLRMEVIEGSLPKAAGWGIKFFLAAQNREQLFQAYGQHQTITGNCHIRIVYAPNERESAEWISAMVGTTTIIKEDITESGPRYGALKNISRTYHEVSRPLMTPDEIMDLRKPQKDDNDRIIEAGEMITFIAGERPIAGTQILYFDDPTFRERSANAPPPTGKTRAGIAA